MGFMDKLLGSSKEYPPLNKDDPAAQKIDAMRQPVEKLVSEIKDPIEVVPGNETAFFFIGKPPKKFGVAWVDKEGNVFNFKSLVEEKGLSMISLEKLSDRLKAVYIEHQEEPRYSMQISDKQVVVTPSETLKSDIKKVIDDTVS
ncbi:MAG: hypothetical protein JSW69_05285 [Deltaproteobacteria bacterium]|nr:MAG: hypothetical protein JSW69_05285 [Deltaproteobacteria bacterium]